MSAFSQFASSSFSFLTMAATDEEVEGRKAKAVLACASAWSCEDDEASFLFLLFRIKALLRLMKFGLRASSGPGPVLFFALRRPYPLLFTFTNFFFVDDAAETLVVFPLLERLTCTDDGVLFFPPFPSFLLPVLPSPAAWDTKSRACLMAFSSASLPFMSSMPYAIKDRNSLFSLRYFWFRASNSSLSREEVASSTRRRCCCCCKSSVLFAPTAKSDFSNNLWFFSSVSSGGRLDRRSGTPGASLWRSMRPEPTLNAWRTDCPLAMES
mmetsp:Transcript_8054/g.13661  ORF Transcript_8054/g.13661 Transcript_8054/m.13661 type:complete len:268 (+) Transcript_8054:919-1722(+)